MEHEMFGCHHSDNEEPWLCERHTFRRIPQEQRQLYGEIELAA